MPSPAAVTIFAFGLTCLVSGIWALLDPTSAAAAMGFSPTCIPVGRGNSLGAIGMGIYYTLAAYQENRTFFILTVPMRLLTTAVFWNQGWKVPSVWEGSGALLTLGALALGPRTVDGRKKVLKSMETNGAREH